MEKEKFYYIDKNGNKKKYFGKIIHKDGLYTGVLTIQEKETVNKELIYHPEVEEVDGYFSYYSYINNAGEEVKYFDNVKKDENGNIYFTYTERNIYELQFNNEIPFQEEYYTYIDSKTGEEKPYSGKITYDKISNTYFGLFKK